MPKLQKVSFTDLVTIGGLDKHATIAEVLFADDPNPEQSTDLIHIRLNARVEKNPLLAEAVVAVLQHARDIIDAEIQRQKSSS